MGDSPGIRDSRRAAPPVGAYSGASIHWASLICILVQYFDQSSMKLVFESISFSFVSAGLVDEGEHDEVEAVK